MTDNTTHSIIGLGRLALAFGRVDRMTSHEDGETLESDTDHTVMLGLVGCAFAAQHPELALDLGAVAQYALVHDLVEVYAGDTPTLVRLSEEQKKGKAAREHAAYVRIADEFRTLPWLASTINAYEACQQPEARYIKAMDKLLPKITHILNGCRTITAQGMSRDELIARYEDQFHELQGYAADFPPLFDLRRDLIDLVLSQMPEPSDFDAVAV